MRKPMTRERATALLSAMLAIAILGAAVTAQPSRSTPSDRLARLESDLRYQLDLDSRLDRATFQQRSKALDSTLEAWRKSPQSQSDYELVAAWLREEQEELGTYDYLGGTQDRVEDGSLEYLTMDYLLDSNAAVCGDPDRAIETFKAYEATGCDIVFCLFNPYNISHESVMQTIELMGKHVIPAFS